MNNPQIQETLGTKYRTKTNKTKTATQKTSDEQDKPRQKPTA
jgi:hypothetical protein